MHTTVLPSMSTNRPPITAIPLLDSAIVSGDASPSAGILIYTVDPATNELVFVVAQEEHHAGWNNSGTWSAFEGGRKPCDSDVFDTAAREFIEESLNVIDMGSWSSLANNLRNGAYTMDVSVSIESGSSSLRTVIENGATTQTVENARRTIRTFIMYMDWEAVTGAPVRFQRRRDDLVQLRDRYEEALRNQENTGELETAIYRLLRILPPGAVIRRGDSTLAFPSDFYEKRRVELWTASKLAKYALSLNHANQSSVTGNPEVREMPKMRAAFAPVVLSCLMELVGHPHVSDMCCIASCDADRHHWRTKSPVQSYI